VAYATDMSLLSTCARPHGVSWMTGVQMASLDHIIWFHRRSRADEWHLYDQDSPSASGARGFNRGAIYTQDGRLVASVAQEGLIRPR
jgi:acyl-CoA thioesterase-2